MFDGFVDPAIKRLLASYWLDSFVTTPSNLTGRMTSSVLDKEENILKELQQFGSKNLFVSKNRSI
ncbi:Hypothetical predicted protein [Paramuricea clavata]|uniref:Uncharacterized protein n=1 Tax=Paramuricea clavata TaxID=317549 RepID=A0A6S7KU05_PARCT|nr:Hypothetical predicted protein [Paramuricea clavata]